MQHLIPFYYPKFKLWGQNSADFFPTHEHKKNIPINSSDIE